MSREIVEKLEQVYNQIPKRYRPKLKEDNVFSEEYYIELNHDIFPKITIDINEIVLHRHKGLFGMFGHPPTRIRMFSTCDNNDWEEELLELLNE